MKRFILHSDFNGFFAAVECLKNPEIADKPVAVAGDPKKRHGIILAKNNLAKEYNIKTGETIWAAQRKCPNLVIVPPHFDEYLNFSQRAFNLYNKYTPFVEPFGLDECWLDITMPHMTFKSAEEFANNLRIQVKDELGITVSIGVSFTKTFAKLASDLKKPDAVSVISDTNYKTVAWNLPCEDMLYVGRSTKKRLNSRGIFTIGDIANVPQDYLHTLLGKHGDSLYIAANGQDTSCVASATDSSVAKSIGNSTTFDHDLTTKDEINTAIYALADKVCDRLRRSGAKCSVVRLGVKDSQLATSESQVTLHIPTNITNEIAEEALKLFYANYDIKLKSVRALGISTSKLSGAEDPYQTNLFDDAQKRKKQTAVDSATDKLRRRYGFSILGRASSIEHMPEDTHCFFKHHKLDETNKE